jgi:hypothetical protein
MNKNTFERISLSQGEVDRYDFGTMRLHAYRTGDPIDDEVFILEKDGRAVILESPCFVDSNRALEAYLADCNLAVAGMLLAYHMAGATFLPGVRKYATANADAYGHAGGGKALIDNFAQVFGDAFDASIHTVTDALTAGPVMIGGIELVIVPTPDAFDVEIPEINAVYTHMLGHDCHSIVAGPGHADALLAQLQGYLDRGFTLVLTSHYTPEDLKDVQTKMDYLRRVKALAAASPDADAFKAEVQRQYPDYSGGNYLDMTAGFFFG